MSSGDASAVASSARGERLLGLDAVRGFALLGITLVNMAFFAHPSALMYAFGGDSAAPWWDRAASLGVSVFCEAKFFPLFSLLFGMGMAIMLMGAGGGQVNAAFVWRYLRRLVCLGVIGLLHAWFIWYGDILFLYAVVGVGLLLFSWAPARGLLIGGAVLVGLGALVTAVLTMLGGGGMGEIDAKLPQSLAEMPPLQRYFEGWTYEGGKYMLATWASAESEVFSGGPYWSAVAMRMLLWVWGLVAGVMGFGWTVLGMFFLGAGLLKAGFFAPERREARRWLVRMGLVVGLPLAIGGGALMHFGGQHMAAVGLGMMAGMLAGPLLALMWASLFAGWAERPGPMATRVLGVLATTGRMGLTNYLLISVMASAIYQHWGMGMFGRTGALEEVGIAIGMWVAVVIASHLWLSVFAMGPMEALWRGVTNLRWPAMQGGGGGGVGGGGEVSRG